MWEVNKENIQHSALVWKLFQYSLSIICNGIELNIIQKWNSACNKTLKVEEENVSSFRDSTHNASYCTSETRSDSDLKHIQQRMTSFLVWGRWPHVINSDELQQQGSVWDALYVYKHYIRKHVGNKNNSSISVFNLNEVWMIADETFFPNSKHFNIRCD